MTTTPVCPHCHQPLPNETSYAVEEADVIATVNSNGSITAIKKLEQGKLASVGPHQTVTRAITKTTTTEYHKDGSIVVTEFDILTNLMTRYTIPSPQLSLFDRPPVSHLQIAK